MSKKSYYRGVEDPISGTFQLAEEISSKADKVLSRFYFSLYFTWFSIFVVGLLMLTFLFRGQLFMFLIFLSVFISGFVTIWLLATTRDFLKKASFRFSAVQAMREGPPAHKIPSGRTKAERFVKYLQKENRMFSRLLKKKPEVLRNDAYIVGRKRRHHFDAFITMKATPFHRLHRRGFPGYAIYIREYRKPPTNRDVIDLTKELSDIYRKNRIYPGRVVLLFRGSRKYSGLEPELYEELTDTKITLPGVLDRKLNLQVVAELPEGDYDFTPFIPELNNYLP
ncbi:MAG: hypothetical protein ACMUIE_02610 [Thermoplasmatota archaeon]